jgi:SDR family mycofactocin-dependent oxidoreductase
MSVAIITGAARGMGAVTARKLADSGWDLVLLDRCEDDPHIGYPLATPEDLEETIEACRLSGRAEGVIGDVRDQSALDKAVALATDRFGGLDAAVAAAGCIGGGIESWNTPEHLWTTLLGVNLEGAWRLANSAVPALLARAHPRHGRFVAVASAAGTVGMYGLAAYSAAKHGVVGLVRSLAAELGPHGITSNAVAPGSTQTMMLAASADLYGLGDTSSLADGHLLQRLLEPEEPAALIAWLCGPDSSGITGAVIPVDAGMTAH